MNIQKYFIYEKYVQVYEKIEKTLHFKLLEENLMKGMVNKGVNNLAINK
jgi:hypothetical protein